jgi:adenylate kinase family enzyme
MRRVSVVGSSGSGKSTVAARLAEQLGVPHNELDAINHQPNWTPLPPDEFRRRVTEVTAPDGWVVDGNYSTVRDIVWARADTVVWLDLPRGVVARRITMRSIRRVARREELWNGNRERLRNLLTRDPEESAIRHSWLNHQKNHDRYEAALADPAFARLHFVQLRSQREIDAFLAEPRVRDARPDERHALESIQYEASLVWEEDRPFVVANPDMIVVEPEWITSGLVRVAVQSGRVLGFSVVLPRADGDRELDGLFVAPDLMRHGIGRLLIEDLTEVAWAAGVPRVVVTANLRAQGFYERSGFVPGRIVPTRFNDARRMHLDRPQ